MPEGYLEQRRGAPCERKCMSEEDCGDRSEDGGGGAEDHDPEHRQAGDPSRVSSLRTLRDADDQQRDDQRNDSHLQGAEPQGSDEGRHRKRFIARPLPKVTRKHSAEDPEDQRRERIVSPVIAGGGHCRRLAVACAQRGFLNLKMKRSVFPRTLGSNTSTSWASPGLRKRSLLPTSTNPARLKSAFTTFGSIRWNLSTVARVSLLALAMWSITPIVAPGFIAA